MLDFIDWFCSCNGFFYASYLRYIFFFIKFIFAFVCVCVCENRVVQMNIL